MCFFQAFSSNLSGLFKKISFLSPLSTLFLSFSFMYFDRLNGLVLSLLILILSKFLLSSLLFEVLIIFISFFLSTTKSKIFFWSLLDSSFIACKVIDY